MPLHETIKYKFNFGQNTTITIETDSLEQEMQSWIDDSAHMKRLWESARTDSAAFQQYDSPQAPLSAVIRSFFDIVSPHRVSSSGILETAFLRSPTTTSIRLP